MADWWTRGGDTAQTWVGVRYWDEPINGLWRPVKKKKCLLQEESVAKRRLELLLPKERLYHHPARS